jgi:hypothetical protein
MGVVYGVEEDDILEFIGDPYRLLEGADPFHGFKPRHIPHNQLLAEMLKAKQGVGTKIDVNMGKQDQTANVDGQQPVNINKGEQK